MAPKRPQPVHKATPGVAQTRQKTKQVVSTSALFAQIPRLKAAPASKHVTAPKQPQTRRKVAVVISKKRRNHPLLDDFNGTSLTLTPNSFPSRKPMLTIHCIRHNIILHYRLTLFRLVKTRFYARRTHQAFGSGDIRISPRSIDQDASLSNFKTTCSNFSHQFSQYSRRKGTAAPLRIAERLCFRELLHQRHRPRDESTTHVSQ